MKKICSRTCIIAFFFFMYAISFQSRAETVSLSASADTLVYEGSPNNNYGTVDALSVCGGNGTRMRSYVKFNLSSIPSGSTVNSASLWLYCTRCYTGGGSYLKIELDSTGGSWTEGGLTWNNQPSSSSVLGNKNFSTTGWHDWQSDSYPLLISLVQGWLDGSVAKNGFRLQFYNENTSPGDINWNSRQYSSSDYRPILIVNYTAPEDTNPPTPNPPTWNESPHAHGTDALHMVATTATDPEENGVEYYFQCCTSGGHDSGFQDSPEYTDTGLNPGTLYYYRIIVRDKSPNQNQTSWSEYGASITYACKPTSPGPANGATDQSVNTDVSWGNGGGASSYEVYFGPLGNMTCRGDQNGTSYDPGILSYSTTYQWRIDAIATDGPASRKTTGDVWSFTTQSQPVAPPSKATNPSPANGATDQSINCTTLSWANGGGATSYHVYFGTPGNLTDRGIIDGTIAYPGITLSYNTTYQWRIDAINSAGTTVGDTWSFTTGPTTLPSISVTPSGLDFGTVAVSPGSSALGSFTVQNTGGGTLSGSAGVSSPFSIYSGGSYSLGAGQSQTVTVRFYPASAGTYNQIVTFTGGGGTTRTITGKGVNVYTITPSAGSGGTISPSAPVTVAAGGSKTFTASPNSGYSVGTWSVDGSGVQSAGSSYTFSNIQANHTVSVTFSQNGAVPLPPTGVSASDGTYPDKVSVTWNASSGVTGYEVWRNTSDNSASAVKLGDSTACGYYDTSAAIGTTYYYWVKAKNTAGTSGFSSSDSGYCALCNKIYLQTGTLASQTINSMNRQVTVEPGARITGSFNVRVHNIMSSGAVAPLAATPTWGTPSSVYWGITSDVNTGDNTYNVPVNLTAPSVAGTYYIVVTMAGTYNYAQLMSGTHPGYNADWVNGNIVAELPASDFETAAAEGWIPFDWYTPSGPASGTMAMATIKVIVSGSGTVVIEPAIRINNSTASQVTLHRGNQVRLNINLDTNSGLDADWWVVVETPFGWYYYSAYDGLWHPTSSSNLHVAYQGDLFDFFSPYEVLNINTAWLQTGTYAFYFGVDTSRNGRLDWDVLHYVWVILNIVQ